MSDDLKYFTKKMKLKSSNIINVTHTFNGKLDIVDTLKQIIIHRLKDENIIL